MRLALLRMIAIITSIGAGIALGAVLFQPVSPQGLEDAPIVADVPVTDRTIDDRRTVQLAFDLAPATSLRSPAEGLVTALECRPGEAVASGEQIMLLDDKRIYALATRTPLWRDLVAGDKGEDVKGLQEELQRLGYPVAADGEIGNHTLRAVADLVGATEAGENGSYTTIPRSSFVWLPAPSVVPLSCSASVGARINEYDELEVLDRSLLRARIVDMPTDLLPGPRRLTVDGQSLPVDEGGIIDDPDVLMTLRSTPSYQRWLSTLKDGPEQLLEASFGLVEPARVSSVSPSVVYAVDGVDACVLDHEVPRPVAIISSELGQTYLVFADGKPAPDSLQIPAEDAPSCR